MAFDGIKFEKKTVLKVLKSLQILSIAELFIFLLQILSSLSKTSNPLMLTWKLFCYVNVRKK